ncbi:hypothetical protein [Streptomyces sp. NPDC059918]|uniref:hypothetical protein n=1 Tax=unclassified Streptomyces TaxID=2593676 RepID=UPI00365FA85B
MATDNTSTLAAEADRIDDRIRARPVLPPLLHASLARRRNAIHAFLTANGTAQ